MKAIVATDKQGLIGIGKGQLPWKSKVDMNWFKEFTKGHTCIFGKNTYDEIPNTPLPHRNNIILSRTPITTDNKNEHYMTLDDIILLDDAVVCGGKQVYELLQPYITEIWITTIDQIIETDNPVYFPNWNWHNWGLVEPTIYKTDIINGKTTTLEIQHYKLMEENHD